MRAGEGDGTECVARISHLCEPGENPGGGFSPSCGVPRSVLTEHLLCAGHGSRCWRHSSEQGRPGPCPGKRMLLVRDELKNAQVNPVILHCL